MGKWREVFFFMPVVGCLSSCVIVPGLGGSSSATAGDGDQDTRGDNGQAPEGCGPLNDSHYVASTKECFCDEAYTWCSNEPYDYKCCIHCDATSTPEQIAMQVGTPCNPDLKLNYCSNQGANTDACGLHESQYFICIPDEEQLQVGPRKGTWALPESSNLACEMLGFTKYTGCYNDENGVAAIGCK